jgi:hypothetical protein
MAEFFGVSVYLSKPIVAADFGRLLQAQEPRFAVHSARFELRSTESESFPHLLEVDGLQRVAPRWRAVYLAAQELSRVCELRATVEFEHPQFPTNPYYCLVFDCGLISLGNNSGWEETNRIAIVQSPFDPFVDLAHAN